ncbi:MAG: endonuclease-3, partial [Myxococcota bacterium]
ANAKVAQRHSHGRHALTNGAFLDRGTMTTDMLTILRNAIPTPHVELDHRNPFELLIATILSAQSTDARVNLATPALFERFPNATALAAATQEEVEEIVRTTGFYRNKATAIRSASASLVADHRGKVPQDMQALLDLRGVARKTANLVMGSAFGIATGIVVDTHVKRVAFRLGWTQQTKPDKVERDLCALLPSEHWVADGHRILLHGRYQCTAKKPACGDCPVNEGCPVSEDDPIGTVAERTARHPAREQG